MAVEYFSCWACRHNLDDLSNEILVGKLLRQKRSREAEAKAVATSSTTTTTTTISETTTSDDQEDTKTESKESLILYCESCEVQRRYANGIYICLTCGYRGCCRPNAFVIEGGHGHGEH